MKYARTLVLLLTVLGSREGSGISLMESLKLVRTRAPELKEFQGSLNKIQAQADALDAAFDAEFGFESDFTRDSFKSQSNPYEQADILQYGMTWGKMIRTGGRYSVGLAHQSTKLTFPEFVRSPTNPVAPGDSFSLNPEYQSSLTLTFSQPFLRNFYASELKLRQEIIKSAWNGPYYSREMNRQVVQAETEQLFVALAELREKIAVTRKIKEFSGEFYRLMVKRENYGRAEKLDIAEAKSREVETAGKLLNLSIAEEETVRRLRYRVYGARPPVQVSFDTPVFREPLIPLPASTVEGLTDTALKNRLDLIMHEKNKETLQKSLDLARESDRSDLSFFTSVAYNGMEDSAGKSFTKADNPRFILGLKLRVPVGGTQVSAAGAEHVAANEEISEKMALIRFQIQRDVEISFRQLEASERLLTQSGVHQKTLIAMLKEEKKRINQARSDEIAAIRYEMDILRAKLDEITAYGQARAAEAHLRLICHGYEKEAS